MILKLKASQISHFTPHYVLILNFNTVIITTLQFKPARAAHYVKTHFLLSQNHLSIVSASPHLKLMFVFFWSPRSDAQTTPLCRSGRTYKPEQKIKKYSALKMKNYRTSLFSTILKNLFLFRSWLSKQEITKYLTL